MFIDPRRIERALTQRIYLTGFDEHLSFKVLSSQGSLIYEVLFKNDITCNCPDNTRGNLCKHIIFVWMRVLRFDICEIKNFPRNIDKIREKLNLIPQSVYNHPVPEIKKKIVDQKPVDGYCPICFEEYSESNEKIIFCKWTCGNNVHSSCYEEWAKYQRGRICIFCRGEFE